MVILAQERAVPAPLLLQLQADDGLRLAAARMEGGGPGLLLAHGFSRFTNGRAIF